MAAYFSNFQKGRKLDDVVYGTACVSRWVQG
jgi:hypothetical protein